MGLRRRLLIVQLLSLLIVTAGGFSGWWIGRSIGTQASRQAQLIALQRQALTDLNVALLESLPFGPDYLATSSLEYLRQHLRADREGLRRFRRLLDDRLAALLLEGIQPDVHDELEQIRLLTVQIESLLRGSELRLAAGEDTSLTPSSALLVQLVRDPSLQALKGHSVRLNQLLHRLSELQERHQRQEAQAIAAGVQVMLLALLVAWAAGLLFAWRTCERILRPLQLLEEGMRGGEQRQLLPRDVFTRAPREIASLANSFNLMVQRLASLVDSLEQLALTDSLTQVGNRRRFDQTLALEWSRMQRSARPMSLLIIDVDHFKAYNDRYGHGQGDTCLIQVATVLRGQGRRCSDLTCRIGGEEFAMLLPETDLAEARAIAERAWRAVRDLGVPHQALGEDGVVTVSVGVASAIPSLEADAEDLRLRADQALYRRKQLEGRDGVTVAASPIATTRTDADPMPGGEAPPLDRALR